MTVVPLWQDNIRYEKIPRIGLGNDGIYFKTSFSKIHHYSYRKRGVKK